MRKKTKKSNTLKLTTIAVILIIFAIIIVFFVFQSKPQQPALVQSLSNEFISVYEQPGNRTKLAVITQVPHNYRDDSGELKKIDENFEQGQTIINSNAYQISNEEGIYKVYAKNSEPEVVVKYNGEQVTLTTQTASNAKISNNAILYENVYKNTDLKYTYLPDRLKEEIIIKQKPAETIYFKQILDYSGIIKIENQDWDGSEKITSSDIRLGDNLLLLKPIAFDANNKKFALSYKISKSEDKVFIETLVPEEILQAASYPFIIDPSISTSLGVGYTEDSYVDSDDTTLNANFGASAVLQLSSNTVERVYAKWNLTNLTSNDIDWIESAKVEYFVNWVGSGSKTISIHGINRSASSWTESGITWNNQPCGTSTPYTGFGCNATPESSVTRSGSTDTRENFTITQIANMTLGNPLASKGLIQYIMNTSGSLSTHELNSREAASDLPVLYITYVTLPREISFVAPADSNRTEGARNYTYVNVSLNVTNLDAFAISWNYTNVSLFGAAGIWHFNNNTLDDSGRDNNGTGLGGVDCSASVAGRFGAACSFDGSDDIVNVSYIASLNSSSKNWTLAAWFKTSSSGDILNKTNFDAAAQYKLIVDSNGKAQFAIKSSGTGVFTVNSSDSVNNNAWHQVVGVRTSGRLLVYVDGNVAGNVSESAGSVDVDNSNLTIGRKFTGTIDEIRIYSRALSGEEINASYNAEVGRYFANFTELKKGMYEYYAWVNNSFGNFNNTGVRVFTISLPTVSIQSPENITYNVSAININYTPGSPDVDQCIREWTNQSGAVYNKSLSGCSNDTLSGISSGLHKVVIWVNDTANNVVSAQVLFTVDITLPNISFVSPTESDGAQSDRNYTYINASVADANPTSSFIDFNKSLALYLDLHNTTRDLSSYGNNGTGQNAVNCSATLPGRFGTACSFDGSQLNRTINITSSASLEPASITVEAWIKLNSQKGNSTGGAPTGQQYILFKRNTRTNNSEGYAIVKNNNTNATSFLITNATGSQLGAAGTTALVTDAWYHVAGTFDNTTKTANIYVNGILEKSNTLAGNFVLNHDSTQNVYIGRTGQPLDSRFNGTIDEIRIWNRALSPEEINASYKGSPLFRNFTSLTNRSYQYYACAVDTGGNRNCTETRQLFVFNNITFVPPADADGANITRTYTYVNVSVKYPVSTVSSYIDFNKSLLLYLSMNNNTLDSSTYGNNGTSINGTVCSPAISGRFGTACDFDGVNDIILINKKSSASVRGRPNYTVEGWFYLDTFPSGQDVYFIYHETIGDGAAARVVVIVEDQSDLYANLPKALTFRFRATDDLGAGSRETINTSANALSTGQWYHFAAVFNAVDDVHKLYLNGNIAAISTRAFDPVVNTTPQENMTIGNDESSNTAEFDGRIDEIRVWGRELSDNEINASYRSSPLFRNFTSLTSGTYQYYACAADTDGNRNCTETKTITVDISLPALTLNEPKNVTYNLSIVTLNYTASDLSLSQCIRSLDNINKSLSGCANETFDETTLGEGSHNIKIWVNDSVDNVVVSEVSFSFRHILLANVTTNATNYTKGEDVNISGVFRWNNLTTIQGAAFNVTIKWFRQDNTVEREINFTPTSSGRFWDNLTLTQNAGNGTWRVNITGFALQNSTVRTVINGTTFSVNGTTPPNVTNLTQTPDTGLAGTLFTFNATLDDQDDGLANYTFSWNGTPRVLQTLGESSFGNSVDSFGRCTMIADDFTPSVTGYVTNITLELQNMTSAKEVYVEIWSINASSQRPLKRIEAAYVNSTLKGRNTYNLILNNTIKVTKNIKYFVVLNGSGATSTTAFRNYYRPRPASFKSYKSANCGNTWTVISGRSPNIRVYVSEFNWTNDTAQLVTGNRNFSITSKIANWKGSFGWYVCANDTRRGKGCSEIKTLSVLNNTDAIPPVSLFFSPSNNSIVNGNVTLKSLVTDSNGVSYVEYYFAENSTDSWIFHANASNPFGNEWHTIWNTITFNNASHFKWRTFAVDTKGNAANGSHFNFSIDRNVPIINGTFVIYPNSSISWTGYGKNITIKANVSDALPGSGLSNASLNLSYLNFTGFGFMQYESGSRDAGEWSIWKSDVNVHRNNSGQELLVQLNVTDNATPLKNSFTYEVIAINLDNVKPRPLDCARNGSLAVYTGEDINFACAFSDNLSGLKNCRMSHNFTSSWANETWQGLAGQDDTCAQNYTFGSAGAFSWFFWENDGLDNINNSDILNITIINASETNAPYVQILWYPNNSFVNRSTFNVTYNVTDVSAINECALFVDADLNSTNQTPVSKGIEQLLLATAVEDGWHDFYVVCEDEFFNVNLSDTFNYTIDTAAPTVSIQSPPNATNSSSTIVLNYTASDTVQLDQCIREWTNQSGAVYNKSLSGCANESWIANDGSHIIRVWVNDTAGNVNVSTVRFTIDANAPTISIQSPPNATNSSSTIVLNYTASDSVGISQCIREWTNQSGTAYNKTMPNCQNETWTGSDGAHTIRIWVNDTAGNVNVSTVRFTIDTAVPSITLNEPKNVTYNLSIVTLNYTASDSSLSQCIRSLDNINKTLANCANETFDESVLGEGSHNIKIWVNDSANNVAVAEVSFSFRHILIANTTTNKSTYNENENVNVSGVFRWDNLTTIQGAAFNITISWIYPNGSLVRQINFTPSASGNYWDNLTLGNINTIANGTWRVNTTGFALQNGTVRTMTNTTTFNANLTEQWTNITSPEGIFEPFNASVVGTHINNFSIRFTDLIIAPSSALRCDIRLPNSSILLVNETGLNLVRSNYSLNYTVKSEDSIVEDATVGYVPWILKNCSIISGGQVIFSQNKTSRIYTHNPTYWKDGEITRAVACEGTPNVYFNNTGKCEFSEDTMFALQMRNGNPVVAACFNNPNVSCDQNYCKGIYFPTCDPIDYFAGLSPNSDDPNGFTSFNVSFAGYTTEVFYTYYTNTSGSFKLRIKQALTSKTFSITIFNLTNINSSLTSVYGNNSGNGTLSATDQGDGTWSVALNRLATSFTGTLDFVFNASFNSSFNDNRTLRLVLAYGSDTNQGTPALFTALFNSSIGLQNRNESQNSSITTDVGGVCGDEANNDFDYINGTFSFSYDCFDPDCDSIQGDNSQTNEFGTGKTGLCKYAAETVCDDSFDNDYDYIRGTDFTDCHDSDCFNKGVTCPASETICNDSINNDWDYTIGEAETAAAQKIENNGTKYNSTHQANITDCEDSDCNGLQGGSSGQNCNWGNETACSDGFNNDALQLKDCELTSVANSTTMPTVANAEYNCAATCRQTNATETGAACNDNVDNDYDAVNVTGYYTGSSNATAGAGIDCRWGGYGSIGTNYNPDEDCNSTILSSGKTCQLQFELNCTDGFDNDFDKDASGMPRANWSVNTAGYLVQFGINYSEDADFDDYDCKVNSLAPASEGANASWCFDGVDNDLDAYYWNGTTYAQNTSTGLDCADPQCLTVTNPSNANQTCLTQEFNETDVFFTSLPFPGLYCSNSIDDDVDGPIDCADSDCLKKFGTCSAGPCYVTENTTWNSCADSKDNDNADGLNCGDSDCIGMLGSTAGFVCRSTETVCDDRFDNDADNMTDCADHTGCDSQTGGRINNVTVYCRASESTAADCFDGFDNDADNSTDCYDTSCNAQCGLSNISGTSILAVPTLAGKTSINSVSNAFIFNYTKRVRKGEFYNITFRETSASTDAQWTLGTASGGVFNKSSFNVSTARLDGYNSSSFTLTETVNGFIVSSNGTSLPSGYAISFSLQAVNHMNSSTYELTYAESSESKTSLNNQITHEIVENVTPVAQIIKVIPNNTGVIYGGIVYLRANISDDYQLGLCDWAVAGVQSFDPANSTQCRGNFSPTVEGNITITVTPVDYYANIGANISVNYTVNILPNGSSITTDKRFYRPAENMTVNATFNIVNDTLGACEIIAKNETAEVSLGSFAANGSGCYNASVRLSSLPDGAYAIFARVNETTENNLADGSTTAIFVCSQLNSGACRFTDFDSNERADFCGVGPIVTIVNPVNTTYETNNISVDFTMSDLIETCKYELNSVNTTLIGCRNATIYANNGTNKILLWVNDVFGNANHSNVVVFTVNASIRVAFVPPTEANDAVIAKDYIYANVTVNVNSIEAWLELNGVNYSMTNLTSNGSAWFFNKTNLVDDTYTLRVWVRTARNSTGVSETRTVTIDTSTLVSFRWRINVTGATTTVDNKGFGYYTASNISNYYSCTEDRTINAIPTFSIIPVGIFNSIQFSSDSATQVTQSYAGNSFVLAITQRGCNETIIPHLTKTEPTKPFIATGEAEDAIEVLIRYNNIDIVTDIDRVGSFKLIIEKNDTDENKLVIRGV